MNNAKDKQKKTVSDLWPKLIEQERDFLLFLFFPTDSKFKKPEPDLEKFKAIELFKIELYLKNELRSNSEAILRECLLQLIITKIQMI